MKKKNSLFLLTLCLFSFRKSTSVLDATSVLDGKISLVVSLEPSTTNKYFQSIKLVDLEGPKTHQPRFGTQTVTSHDVFGYWLLERHITFTCSLTCDNQEYLASWSEKLVNLFLWVTGHLTPWLCNTPLWASALSLAFSRAQQAMCLARVLQMEDPIVRSRKPYIINGFSLIILHAYQLLPSIEIAHRLPSLLSNPSPQPKLLCLFPLTTLQFFDIRGLALRNPTQNIDCENLDAFLFFSLI